MIRHAEPNEIITPAEFVYAMEGIGMTHNYLCAVCRERPAVIKCWTGVLMPCWSCQKLGFNIVRTNKFTTWILEKMGAMA